MARLSSRELALERRKALTTSGKKAPAAASAGANRVRTASDARATRTNANSDVQVAAVPAAPVAVSSRRTAGLTASAAPVRSVDAW